MNYSKAILKAHSNHCSDDDWALLDKIQSFCPDQLPYMGAMLHHAIFNRKTMNLNADDFSSEFFHSFRRMCHEYEGITFGNLCHFDISKKGYLIGREANMVEALLDKEKQILRNLYSMRSIAYIEFFRKLHEYIVEKREFVAENIGELPNIPYNIQDFNEADLPEFKAFDREVNEQSIMREFAQSINHTLKGNVVDNQTLMIRFEQYWVSLDQDDKLAAKDSCGLILVYFEDFLYHDVYS